MSKGFFTKQKSIPFIGVFRQLFGGAATWITLATFVFAGMSAWSSPIMIAMRTVLPWLTLPVFISILVMGLAFAMWLEHKFVQPSVMVYWNRMFGEQKNPLVEKVDKLREEQAEIRAMLEKVLEARKDKK